MNFKKTIQSRALSPALIAKVSTTFLLGLTLVSSAGWADRTSVRNGNGMRQGVGSMPDLEPQTYAQVLDVATDGTITVRDLGDGKIRTFRIEKGVPLRAQAPREFGGRRRIESKDLEAGRILRITLRYPYNPIQRVQALPWGKIPRTNQEADPYDAPRLPPRITMAEAN